MPQVVSAGSLPQISSVYRHNLGSRNNTYQRCRMSTSAVGEAGKWRLQGPRSRFEFALGRKIAEFKFVKVSTFQYINPFKYDILPCRKYWISTDRKKAGVGASEGNVAQTRDRQTPRKHARSRSLVLSLSLPLSLALSRHRSCSSVGLVACSRIAPALSTHSVFMLEGGA